MRSRNPFRVLVAPSTRIDDIVAGNVELSSIYCGTQTPHGLSLESSTFKELYLPAQPAASVP